MVMANVHSMTSRIALIFAVAVLGLAPAQATHAATAQLSATPTTIESGSSTTLTWNCYGGSANIDQGVGPVATWGSYSVSPVTTKTYTLHCTDGGTSQATAAVTITVDNQGCYADSEPIVDGNAIIPDYDARNVIFNEQGTNSLNGGGTFDGQNHYQQCIADCALYGKCNYMFVNDFGSSETSLTKFLCTYVDPVTGPSEYMAPVTKYFTAAAGGGIHTETVYWSIEWRTSEGGMCEPLPPAPTVTLTPALQTITSGQSATLTWSSTNADSCVRTPSNTFGMATPSATALSGSKSVSPTTTMDYYVTCTNEAGMAVASARIAVGSTPDLAAGAITPTTATSSVATTFSATVTNSGASTTGASFPVLFQRATSGGGANATDLGSTTTATLAAGASRAVTFSATLPTAGNWFMRACADKRSGGDANGLITTESNEVNNCGAWTQIIVAAGTATYPNLTASIPTPSTAVAGTAKTFSSTITNTSATSTGKTTQNVFQIDLDSDHSTVTTSRSGSATPTLAGGATNVSTVSYTFSAAGTFYVRACADNNTSMSGTLIESNEGDNCSSWRTVTVSASGSTAMTCSVSATTITVGGSVTWSAVPANLGIYSWTPSETGTALVGPSNRNATLSRTYAAAGFYGMDVTANAGAYSDSCPTITVGNPCGTPSTTVTADPGRVTVGSTATITFNASGINGSCTLTGPGVNQTVSANSCSVADTDIVTPPITGQSVYTLSCTGAADATAIVNVIPRFQEF